MRSLERYHLWPHRMNSSSQSNLWTSTMTMNTEGSVTRLIDALAGDDVDTAAAKLWQCYFDRLVRLAHARLRAAPRGAADEEDVALSAFNSVCRGAAQGRFPGLGDRRDLWRLLVTITVRK